MILHGAMLLDMILHDFRSIGSKKGAHTKSPKVKHPDMTIGDLQITKFKFSRIFGVHWTTGGRQVNSMDCGWTHLVDVSIDTFMHISTATSIVCMSLLY